MSRTDRPRYMRIAPMSSESAVAELGARLSAPTTSLRDAVEAINAATTGRHGLMDSRAVIANARAWRDDVRQGTQNRTQNSADEVTR